MKKLKFSKIMFHISVLAIMIFQMLPIIVLIVASFSQEGYLSFPPKGYSLKWYYSFFSSTAFLSAFWVSIKLAVLTTAVSLIFGTITAYSIDRSRYREALISLFVSPLMIPALIIGLALLQWFKILGIRLGFATLLIGQIVITLPFIIRGCVAALYRFDISLEEAAQTLGCSRIKTFWYITVPLLKPALIASGCFAFIASFGNTAISIFLSTARVTTLPVRLYTYAMFTPDPIIAAISTCTLLLAIIVVVIIEKNSNLNDL